MAQAIAPEQAGTTSRMARQEAAAAIPLAKLHADDRMRVQRVLDDTTVFRRMPTQLIECDPEFFLFLVEHPDVVVNIWQVLDISDVQLDAIGPRQYDADDASGTVGKVELVYRSPETHVFYADGKYEGHFFPRPVTGRIVLLLRSRFMRDADGTEFVHARLDAFVQMDNFSAEILAKTFQPLVAPVADHNFRETTSFASTLNRAAVVNYQGVEELAQRLKRIEDDTRKEFCKLSERVAIRAALSETTRTAERPKNDKSALR